MTKKLIFLGSVLAVLMLGSCVIIQPSEIAVEAVIKTITISAPNDVVVTYDVTNIGKFDLTDVRVRFSLNFDAVTTPTTYDDYTEWGFPIANLPVGVTASRTITLTSLGDITNDADVEISAIAMDDPQQQDEYQY